MTEWLGSRQPIRGELFGLACAQAVEEPALGDVAHGESELRKDRGRTAEAVVDRREFDLAPCHCAGGHGRVGLQPRVDVPELGSRDKIRCTDGSRRDETQLIPVGQEIDAGVLIPLGCLRPKERSAGTGLRKLQTSVAPS